MLTGAVGHSNEGANPSFVSWVKAITVVSLMTLLVICVAACALSMDFALTVEPPLPFGFWIFSNRLDIFASSCLPTTFTWGWYHFEIYIGRRPRPMLAHVRDYASLSAGGRTIEALTSVAYTPPSPSHYLVLLSWLGRGRRENSPALTLTDGMEPGQCWAVRGDAGQLGIQLTHPIRVSHLTVGHQSKLPTTSAPKNLVLWGLKPDDSELCTTPGSVGNVGTPTPDFGSGYCGIHLLSGIYELSNSTHYQNFTTSVNHGHYFDRMIVQVVGNWGNANFTCIYHIQIYSTA